MEECLERCEASGFQMEEGGSKPRGQTVEAGKGKDMDFSLRASRMDSLVLAH